MRIRRATQTDLPALKTVEELAAKAFEKVETGGYHFDRTVDPELLLKLIIRGTLWVAVNDKDVPVGFAACYPLDGFFYLHEISVAQEAQGQGIGRRLMGVLEDYAYDQNFPYVGLVTFRDIRWNGPFYHSLGYKEIAPDTYSGLHNKYQDDIRHGHDPALRCVMIKVLED